MVLFTVMKHTYAKNEATQWPIPNHWDIVALILVITVIALVGWGAKSMTGQYVVGQPLPISLKPIYLPYYALLTVLRMFTAMACSLLFTFIFGTWAAKSRQAERIIIPIIDILQSVPVLGFLGITLVAFIVLFRGSMLGPESAAVFVIFTAQVWNMTLSFYQSIKTVPKELYEASDMFHLSAWQRFWRIEVPFAMPGLLWNAMMSMSGSWVFLVAAEAISVGNYHITLPGVGSYISMAILHKDKAAIGYAIITMFVVIAIYDQLIFRPLTAWAEKFKSDLTSNEVEAESWVLDLFQQARFFQYIGGFLSIIGDTFVNLRLFRRKLVRSYYQPAKLTRRLVNIVWNVVLVIITLVAAAVLLRFIMRGVDLQQILHVVYLGLITAIRVMVVIVLSSIIWVPVGVWIGSNPRASRIAQPIAQFFAAFPVNLFFPIVAFFILTYHLNVNIWTSPLMILGTQWYILFNVIAGTIALPKNLHQAVGTLNLRGWLWWKRFVLPGIFPYYITGAITAAGGAWNISILAEYVSWGHTHLIATGLGAYITEVSRKGNYTELVLGIVVMSLYVLVINRFVWRPLYSLAQRKYNLS